MPYRIGAVFFAFIFILANAAAQSPPAPLTADGGFTSTPVLNCQSDLRYFNQISGWQVAWPSQWANLVAGGPESLDDATARWSAAPAAILETQANLRAGIENRQTAPRAVVVRVLQQVRDLASMLAERSTDYYFADASHQAAGRWNAQMKTVIAPAVAAHASFLESEYLPAANPAPGLFAIKDGAACFAGAVEWWTTLDMAPEEIEQAGRRLLEETRAGLLATGREGETFEMIMARLRAGNAANETTGDELIAISAAAIARAEDKAADMFAAAPKKGSITIVEMPAHMQPSFPAGFYRRPQGEQPAAYVINPSRPGERRLMAEVIAFHETLPGHHLFFAYPRENESEGFNAGLLEGWAIYSEYVAGELGLYSTSLDRQGMITKHLWAASRLVVEPGLHLRGWSRQEAIEFMLENTVLPRLEIEIEVDRYLALPGQSLSYMLGADLLLSERARARATMGEAFDVKAFHDVVLAPGARPLPQVRDDIRAWAEGE